MENLRELIRDIDKHMRVEWYAGRLPAESWPKSLSDRLAAAVAAKPWPMYEDSDGAIRAVDPDDLKAALAAAPAAAPGVLPAGWVAIPLEPTESQWLYAQGTLLDMNWDAVTCLAARIQALIASTRKQWASACAAHQGEADARDLLIESAVIAERERICAAIKAEDDHCVTEGDYMLDSDDCIKVARGEWVRPVYDAAIAAAKAKA